MAMILTPERRRLVSCCIVLVVAALTVAQGQPAASLSVEQLLRDRLGISAADIARFTAGSAVVWPIPPSADNEVAAAGAIRAKGDLRRILAWLRDIEAFIRAAGTENVGALADPATPADLGRIKLDTGGDAAAQRAELSARIAAYQRGGDDAVDAIHKRAGSSSSTEFKDMLRRSTKVWDLDYPFVSYLESYPSASPAGTESRFYWTNDKVLTLHHVVIRTLDGSRLLVADKQFYASRDIDAGLMIAFAVPNEALTSFDLVVAVKARADAMRGVAARLLRGRIEKEVREGLAMYLDWIRGSAAL
jgi:hypothetical protein